MIGSDEEAARALDTLGRAEEGAGQDRGRAEGGATGQFEPQEAREGWQDQASVVEDPADRREAAVGFIRAYFGTWESPVSALVANDGLEAVLAILNGREICSPLAKEVFTHRDDFI